MNAERALQTQQGAALVEKVVIGGDLKDLAPAERVAYYRQVCESLGLNPLTKPFDYITLNGKLTLYAKKDAADQLRKRDGVSVTGLDAQIVNDVYVVKASARVGDRTDMATGAVSIKGLSGDNLANAMMKAETKAKRRATLSICGLGMLDETEVETVADARPVIVDATTGEIKGQAAQGGNGHDKPAASKVYAGSNGERVEEPTDPKSMYLVHFLATKKNQESWAVTLKNKFDIDVAGGWKALGVDGPSEYHGTVGEALRALQNWDAERSQTAEVKPLFEDGAA